MRRGRKYTPTDADRQHVAMYSGLGLSHAKIAIKMQISEPTLRRYFAAELERGPIDAELAMRTSLYRAAVRRTKPDLKAALFFLPPESQPRAPLGKKAQAQLDALTAEEGSEWANLLN